MPNVPNGKVGPQDENEEKASFGCQVVPLGYAAHKPIELQHLRSGMRSWGHSLVDAKATIT